jgi:hypothetical protein
MKIGWYNMKGKFFFAVFLFSAMAFCFSDGFTEEEQEIVDLLYETQTYPGKIIFIKKVDMGISGDNYITLWSDRTTVIYMIDRNTGTIKECFVGIIFYPDGYSRFDIMKDIPGTRIGNGCGAIGDYNNDGIAEVFTYGFYGSYKRIEIFGYDSVKDEFVAYLSVIFNLVDPERGPAPAEFTTYQGVEGIKIYQDVYNHPPKHYPKYVVGNISRSWYFYAWDEGSREYVELAEVGEDIDYSMFTGTDSEDAEPDPVADVPPPEPESPAPAAEPAVEAGLNSRMVFAGAAGFLVLGIAVIMVVLRKKRRP